MKKYLILIGGILLLLLGIGLGTIGVATIVMIIQSGSADGLNIALGVIMLVFVVGAVGMILNGGKLIRNARKEINLQYMMEKQENKKPADLLMETDYGSNRWYVMEEQENKKPSGNRNGKVWISVGLLLAAVLCIDMLFIFQGQFAIQMILMMVGAVCMLVFGTLRGIAFKRSEKYKYGTYRQLQGVIGLPVMIYFAIAYFILEYVVGW